LLRLATICCLTLVTTKVGATMTIDKILGVSATSISGTTINVFGGVAGTQGGDLSNPFNSRAVNLTPTCNKTPGQNEAPLCACNTARIYDQLDVYISVTRSDATGRLALAPTGTNTTAFTTVSDQQTNSLKVKWSDICGHMPSPGSCEAVTTGQAIT